MIFQHVPVERCQQLIADVTGAAVSAGLVHSVLAAGGVPLITAAAVAGFDETTLRSGPARGDKMCVHGAFTEQYSAFWLGARSLDSMQDAGISPGFAGIVVSDRYQNYFHSRGSASPRTRHAWLTYGGGHPFLQVAATAFVHHGGEGVDADGEGGQFG